MNKRIIGNTTATPMPVSDWNQTNEAKADYIKNKPILGGLSSKDIISVTDLDSSVQASLAKVENIDSLEGLLRSILYAIQNGEVTTNTIAEIERLLVSYLENIPVEEVES